MAKVLVVYGSKYGQAAKVASLVGEEIWNQGHSCDIFNVDEIAPSVDPRDYDFVVIGGPVYMGEYPRNLRKWVRRNASLLNLMPSVFFSVCMSKLQEGKAARDRERKVAERFFQKTGWLPQKQAVFAGSLAYTKYNPFTRLFMKWISRRSGGSVDTSRDLEYTDWNEVRDFAKDLIVREEVAA